METLSYHVIHTYLIVQGNCDICKDRIEKAALSVNGVCFANWNISDGKLSLTFDPHKTDMDEISLAITHIGHDTNLHKASHDVQGQMQDCCKPVKKE